MDNADTVLEGTKPAQIHRYPNLSALVKQQLAVFPDHADYLKRRFQNEDDGRLQFDDFVAEKILRIAGSDLAGVCEDYRWLCGEMLTEELHFRRTGKYRLSTIAEAIREVYGNFDFMKKYVNGILASQLWWDNHNAALHYFRYQFLPGNKPGFSHLEVGPGHGLYLHLAASTPGCARAEGWDVSDASLTATKNALVAMGSESRVHLRKVDFSVGAPKDQFQSITFSEVLEHLEAPEEALSLLYGLLEPGGRIFINAPVNSPAPDHIYLFRTPEEVVQMVERAGFKVRETFFAACTGSSLPRARKLGLSISTLVTAQKE